METHSRKFFESDKADLKEAFVTAPILIGIHLRTPNNMGSLIRIADNFNCKKVILVDNDPSFRDRNIRKTAKASFGAVEWVFCTDEELNDHIPDNYQRIAIETSADAKNIYTHRLPDACAFFFGNERMGLNDAYLEQADQSIFVPMPGGNKSMNVSHACAVVVAEWMRQQWYS